MAEPWILLALCGIATYAFRGLGAGLCMLPGRKRTGERFHDLGTQRRPFG